MKTKLLLSVLTCLASTALFAADSPPVGSTAPDFSVSDSKGKTHSVSQYKGKYVVLEWFNPKCPFVKKHYGSGNMQKLQSTYTKQGVVWLSVLSSAKGKEGYMTAPQLQAYRSKKGVSSTATLMDPSGDVGKLYGAKTT